MEEKGYILKDRLSGLYKRKNKVEFTSSIVATTIYTTRSNAFAGKRRWEQYSKIDIDVEICDVYVSTIKEKKESWIKKLFKKGKN